MPLQTSGASGEVVARESSQSPAQTRAPEPSRLQHASLTTPSRSLSRGPSVVGSQSSSWASASHTSVLLGKRFASSSAQSEPPQPILGSPSSSASGVLHSLEQRSALSSHTAVGQG